MKKKILATLLALTLSMASAFTAFAASPTVGTTEAPAAGQKVATTVASAAVGQTAAQAATSFAAATVSATPGVTVAAASANSIKATEVAVQNAILNQVALMASVFNSQTLAAAATDASKNVIGTIESVVNLNVNGAQQNADGTITMTLSVPNVAPGDMVVALFYSETTGWTYVPVSVTGLGQINITGMGTGLYAITKLDIA